MKYLFLIVLCLIISSCIDMRERKLLSLVQEWQNKQIQIPQQSVFTIYGTDTIHFPIEGKFRVLTYLDSIGCMSCKMNLSGWREMMKLVDSLSLDSVQFLFFFASNDKVEIIQRLKMDRFTYPVCIDKNDSFNHLNKLPSIPNFQTFLLNADNKVLAVGNPVANPKIKELYLKIIQGQPIGEEKETIQTQVAVPETSFTFGDFSWQEAQTHSFEVKNTGNKPLVIQDVTTSCGCITVDFTKEPVQPGGTAIVKVTYKADRAEYFNKTVTVYGNAEQLPVQLHVSGNAK